MFYEEKVVDGVLHSRPDAEASFTPLSHSELRSRIRRALQNVVERKTREAFEMEKDELTSVLLDLQEEDDDFT
mgnify:CR=1 FL=1